MSGHRMTFLLVNVPSSEIVWMSLNTQQTDQIPVCLYLSATAWVSTENEQMLHCVSDALRTRRMKSSEEGLMQS